MSFYRAGEYLVYSRINLLLQFFYGPASEGIKKEIAIRKEMNLDFFDVNSNKKDAYFMRIFSA